MFLELELLSVHNRVLVCFVQKVYKAVMVGMRELFGCLASRAIRRISGDYPGEHLDVA